MSGSGLKTSYVVLILSVLVVFSILSAIELLTLATMGNIGEGFLLVLLLEMLVKLPLTWILSIVLFKIASWKLNLSKLNLLIVIFITAFCSYLLTAMFWPAIFAVESIPTQIENYNFRVDFKLAEEQLIEVDSKVPPYFGGDPYKYEYRFKIIADNKTEREFKNSSVSISILNSNQFFVNDIRYVHMNYDIKPGMNAIQGSYAISAIPSYTNSNFPTPQLLPRKVFISLTIRNGLVERAVDLDSYLTDWSRVYREQLDWWNQYHIRS